MESKFFCKNNLALYEGVSVCKLFNIFSNGWLFFGHIAIRLTAVIDILEIT